MNNDNSSVLYRLSHSKRFVMIVCLVAAAITWFSITVIENPGMTKTVSQIAVVIPNDKTTGPGSMGLQLIGKNEYLVSAEVRGPRGKILNLANTDIQITASLSGVNKAGESRVQLSAKISGDNADVEIASINPPTLILRFDTITTKEFGVDAQVENVSAVIGLTADPAVITDTENSQITIEGPSTKVSAINTVVAYKKLEDPVVLSATQEYEAEIKLYDIDKREITHDDLILDFTKTSVTVPVSQQKSVKIEAAFANTPEEYKNNPIPYSLSAVGLDVSGAPEDIAALSVLTLPPIDFREITLNNRVFTRNITLSSGIKNRSNVDSVTVTVNLNGFRSRMVNVQAKNVQFKNLAPGLSAAAAGNISDITIIGPSAQINSMKVADVYAEVDMSGKTAPGSFRLEAIIKVRDKNGIWAVGVHTVVVEIR